MLGGESLFISLIIHNNQAVYSIALYLKPFVSHSCRATVAFWSADLNMILPFNIQQAIDALPGLAADSLNLITLALTEQTLETVKGLICNFLDL